MPVRICALEDIVRDSGVAALVDGEQVAVFRLSDDRVFALGNRDPFSGANVLSRGIVGDLKGELVVASPVYKQHFSLATGRCLEDATVRIPTYVARVEDGFVVVEPHTRVTTTCCYCGVGCGVVVSAAGSNVVAVQGDKTHPANFGRLCTKGAALDLSAAAGGRLLYPEVNGERRTWDQALDHAAAKFRDIIAAHGPDAVAFYISGQLLTEDYYVFNKLAKGLVGTNNVDTNSRLCMSSAVAGYKQSLGADAPPCAYEDIDAADLIFIAGSNTAFAHPILYRRIEDARAKNPALKVIVADPRATVTARAADLHLALKPGTDIALFNGMLNVFFREGFLEKTYMEEHTENFQNLEQLIATWTPERAAEVCELPVEKIVEAARLFGRATAALSLYCQGLNQSASGTAKNSALINLHLATGQIGRPGAGPFSLTGQPNAMGGREVGGMANLLSAHRDLSSATDRAEVAAFWGVEDVPAKPGKTAVEMFEAVGRGEIKAVWIACTNPAQSMPDVNAVRKALEVAEFVVVQEAFRDAETCDYADVLLPAATWAEKEGTVTNSERRISRVRAAVPPPGQARPDWRIAVDFARRLAGEELFGYQNPEEIFNEHRESTRGRDLDITGLSWDLLDTQGPQQWPCPADPASGGKVDGNATALLPAGRRDLGKARLYEDGVFPTPDGKARFANVAYRPLAEPRESRYPFSLTTGRLRDQWHGMSRTGTLGRLFGHVAEPCVQMNPQDMERRAVKEGELVHVTSKRGSIVVPVQASDELSLGQAFIAMHWGAEYLSGCSSTGAPLAGVNALTTSAFCPTSKQPELKHAAVKILKAELAWSLLGVAWLADDDALRVREALRHIMVLFPFASCVPFGRERSGILLRAAAHETPPDELLARIEGLLGLATPETLRYADRKRGQRRALRLVRTGDEARLDAFMLAGDTTAEAWIKTLLQDELPAQAYGRLLLVPGAKAPVAVQARGKQICTCFNVTDAQITEHLLECRGIAAERLSSLQASLKCGTNCGSCIPELKRMVGASTSSPHAA